MSRKRRDHRRPWEPRPPAPPATDTQAFPDLSCLLEAIPQPSAKDPAPRHAPEFAPHTAQEIPLSDHQGRPLVIAIYRLHDDQDRQHGHAVYLRDLDGYEQLFDLDPAPAP